MIYRNTPQWFVAIDKPLDDGMDTYGATIRERALTSIDRLVQWAPVTGRNRLYSMIEARPDWVLSRQRAWGVPLTCFVKRGADGTAEILRDPAVNARIKAAFETEGADAWFEEEAKARFLGNDHPHGDWEKVTDILDVWFDSGSTHAFVLRDRPDGIWPASVYLEGTDQHRGWFHSSMLQSCGTRGRAPYDAVITHGFTLDEAGMKMSKSAGTATAPQDVVKQYGADILRLWVAQTDYAVDQRIGPEILKGMADSYRRLRNTLRFLLGALEGFGEAERVAPAAMPELERWVLHRLAELDRDGARGLCRLRLPAGVPDAVPVRDGGSLGLLFRYPQGLALLRRGRRSAAAGGADGARRAVPAAGDVAGADAGLHHGGGLARALSRRGKLGASGRLPRDAGGMARPRAGGEVGGGAAGPAGGDRRAGDRAAREAHRREPGGGAAWCMSRDAGLRGGAGLGRLRRMSASPRASR